MFTFQDIKQYWHFQRVTGKRYYSLSIAYIKQYWHFQRDAGKQYYTLFQSLQQTKLIFSGSYWQYSTHFQSFHQTILVFSGIYWQKILYTSGFHIIITRYWHFQRVNTKQYWLIQSSYQTVFILSQSYYHFFEMSEWTLEQTENYQTKHFHLKVRKVTNETYNFAVNYSWVYMIGRWSLWKKMA